MEKKNMKDGNCCGCHGQPFYKRVMNSVTSTFDRYGNFVGHHPLPFIILPIVIFGGLGAGLWTLDEETDIERLYLPKESRALTDGETVNRLFSVSSFVPIRGVTILFRSKTGGDIFSNSSLFEIRHIVSFVKSIEVRHENRTLKHDDVCVSDVNGCVVDGEYALSDTFQKALKVRRVTYPYWSTQRGPLVLATAISGVKTGPGQVLHSATVLKITFMLRSGSRPWQGKFLALAADLDPVYMEMTYGTPYSMEDELAKNTKNDMWMFGLTMVIMLLYACAVSAGGDPLSTRAMVAVAGILAATLATLGSFGLLSLFGVKYVNILGALPFLVLGIGVDDMFLLMSAWSETIHKTQLTVPARVGQTFAGAGIGITITSVTDFIAFLVGTGSVFGSVTNFCLYAGVAVFFCYLCNVSLVGACLAFHGRRVYSSRHFLTCLKIRPRDVLTANGRSQCYVLCCGGSVPTKPRADESLAEKLPRLIVPKIVFNTYVRVVILLGFLGYVAAAVYGAVNLEQGLNVRDMVPPSSYFYSYLQLDNEYFPMRLPVDFIVREKIDYSGKDGDVFLNLLKQAEKDPDIVTNFSRCWLTAYRNSSFFDSASPENFVRNLQAFLSTCPEFEADVVFDSSRVEVVASKCPVLSGGIKEQYDQAELMIRMRKLADDCPLPVFAYHDVFKIYEQYVHTLPATLQMVGSAVLVMTLVTFMFLPHVLLVLLVTLTIVMILVGVFGVMHFWDLSLSPITMIELIMSVGFSVDYSAHVCAAYLVSSADTREARATDAIAHASGPIFNGAMSTLLGVFMLVFSDSYLFRSFFRIMLLVTIFGMLHAVLFLPAVLSLIGPHTSSPRTPSNNHNVPPTDGPPESRTNSRKLSSARFSPTS